MDKDEEQLIRDLNNNQISGNDICSCMGTLEMLLIEEAVQPFIDFLQYKHRPLWLREFAA
jgi:hypothetical protein